MCTAGQFHTLLACLLLGLQIFAFGMTSGTAQAAPFDFNGDGKSDLLVQNSNTGQIDAYLMNGTTVSASAVLIAPASGWSITHTADFNGDGKTDILWRHSDGRVAIWLMNGLTQLSSTALLGPGTGWSVTHTADLNGDGKADILLRHTNGSVVAWLMNGSLVASSGPLIAAGTGWFIAHTADLNGDGKADILWRHPDGSVAAWLMNGVAAAAGGLFMSAGAGWSITHMADLNGDGKADILWRHTDGSVATWLMDGVSAINGTSFMGAGAGWSITHTADLNGDGKADILWRHTDGSVAVWLMNGLSAVSGGLFMSAGAGWSITHTADLNGDGKADIVWRNVDGTVFVWLMNGTISTAGMGITGAGVRRIVPPNPNVNQSPFINITAPTNGATIPSGSNVAINADVSDSDGTVTKVEFFDGATKLGEDLTPPFAFTWTSPSVGAHTLTAKATDNGGAQTLSTGVSFNVTLASAVGGITQVDAASAFGWACIPGDANTKVTITVGLWDGISVIKEAQILADKQMLDIGRAGICGDPGNVEAYYHGFEWPVFVPDDKAIKNKYYDFKAFVATGTNPYTQLIDTRRVGYIESGMPASRTWRTDYDNNTLTQPSLVSCVWPFHGANQRVWTSPVPQHPFSRPVIGGGGTPGGAYLDASTGTIIAGSYGNIGFNSPNIFCINYPATAELPPPWSASNSAAGNASGFMWPPGVASQPQWPTANYWVVHTNNEISYQLVDQPGTGWKASSGPPSQSEPVTGGLYSVSTAVNAVSNINGDFKLNIDNANTAHKGKLPWLSVGAQMGRGVEGPLTFIDPTGAETFLEFDIQKTAAPVIPPPPAKPDYHAINVLVEAIFGGAKRQIWITLQEEISGRYQWNWNIAQSFFYPGADLNLFTPREILACGNLPTGTKVPDLATAPVGARRSYSIPIRAIFTCLDSVSSLWPRYWGISPIGFSRPMLISGIHVGIETGPSPTTKLGVLFTPPRLVKR
jgi:hypothetical protein